MRNIITVRFDEDGYQVLKTLLMEINQRSGDCKYIDDGIEFTREFTPYEVACLEEALTDLIDA